jgi:histidine triad (HIT) family protein
VSTIFTKIINGDIPCEKLAEDDRFFAFLDIRPIHEGHTLVIPKREVDYFFDLDDDLLGGIMTFAKPIASALKAVVPCERVGVMVAGLEVPHAHVHLVPISDVGQLSFAHAREADPTELADLAEKIRRHL